MEQHCSRDWHQARQIKLDLNQGVQKLNAYHQSITLKDGHEILNSC